MLAMKGTSQQNDLFCSKVCTLFNFLLSGEAALSVHSLWVSARLALIDKTDGSDAKRMLGIGEVLYRALAAAVISTTRDAAADDGSISLRHTWRRGDGGPAC